MKNFVKAVSVVGLFAVSGLALADNCPAHMSVQQIYDCIVVEGAGGTYELTPQAQPNQAEQAGHQSGEQAIPATQVAAQ